MTRTTHTTICRFCHAYCGIEVDVEDNRVLAVRGDRHHAVSQGFTCEKGRQLPAQHHDPAPGLDRLDADAAADPGGGADDQHPCARQIRRHRYLPRAPR